MSSDMCCGVKSSVANSASRWGPFPNLFIVGKTFKYTYIRAWRSASGSSARLSLHQLQGKALWSPRNLVPDWRVTAWG